MSGLILSVAYFGGDESQTVDDRQHLDLHEEVDVLVVLQLVASVRGSAGGYARD